jgi:GNAT superfamily N-acetyltransferase
MPSTEPSPSQFSRKTEFDLAGSRVRVRPVTGEDGPFLLGVYESSREDELSMVQWPEGQREWFVRSQFELQHQEYVSRYRNARYEVVEVDDEPAGRIWTTEDEEQIRLLDIALLPAFQNRGIGTVLLQELTREAEAAMKKLRHMVFVLNPNAERFYERLGFVTFEQHGPYKHMEWRGTKTN